jgi:predicted NBD/HSP70 family sugar kinase
VLPDSAGDGKVTDLEPEVAEVIQRAKAGDKVALAALTEAGQALGRSVSIVANLLDPEVVVLGGYFVPLAPWLLPPAQEELRARSVAPQECAQIVASTLGHGAAATGGAAAVLDHIDAGNLPHL